MYEINGNLIHINGYDNFKQIIGLITSEFAILFSDLNYDKIPLYIDNCYDCGKSNTGHVPIITPVLNKILIIKLGVEDFLNSSKIIFQFSHEYVHYIFYSLLGLDKKIADNREENICTAFSLAFIKKYFPYDFEEYFHYVENLDNLAYSGGAKLGVECDFDLYMLKKITLIRIEEIAGGHI